MSYVGGNPSVLFHFTDIKNYPLGKMTVSSNIRSDKSTPGDNAYSISFQITVLDCLAEPFTFGNIPATSSLHKNVSFPSFGV